MCNFCAERFSPTFLFDPTAKLRILIYFCFTCAPNQRWFESKCCSCWARAVVIFSERVSKTAIDRMWNVINHALARRRSWSCSMGLSTVKSHLPSDWIVKLFRNCDKFFVDISCLFFFSVWFGVYPIWWLKNIPISRKCFTNFIKKSSLFFHFALINTFLLFTFFLSRSSHFFSTTKKLNDV